MDPPNLQLHMEQFPLKEIEKPIKCHLHMGQMRKQRTVKHVGGAETQSCHKPHPSTATHNREGTPHYQLPPEERRVWTPHLVSQLLRPVFPASTITNLDSGHCSLLVHCHYF